MANTDMACDLSVDARHCRSIGLMADSHGPIDPRVLDSLKDCDLLVHAGDFVNSETLTELQHAGVIVVKGNNDLGGTAFEGRRKSLPEAAEIALFNGSLVVVHGHQFPRAHSRHEALRKRFPGAKMIVYGHSHRLCVDRESVPWVLNPGACGRARTFGGPSALVLLRKSKSWELRELRFPLLKKRRC